MVQKANSLCMLNYVNSYDVYIYNKTYDNTVSPSWQSSMHW